MVKIAVFSLANGAKKGDYDLEPGVFDAPYRPDILKMVIDWQLAKRRAGTHSSRTISQVSGTTAKPHRQKGTGRARQGSLRSPQFRGGAVIFGPIVRDHGYSINKKVRKFALKSALSYKAQAQQLIIFDDIAEISSKTRDLQSILCKICSKSILIVDSLINDDLKRSSRNLKHVDVLPAVGINPYDIMKHQIIAIGMQAAKEIESRLL
ncbi:Large ribosomal subunit protein uL4 [Candidatus Xenohaliotis californiensis]|uniref:Large ribosomal subunit protein uL4 n=1 Tax=Candidatus Xenohaliotis californiensis TaxID=84677 RepID=A0ABP0ET88_9RICK|nr:Large ribosomal subunit protein uL4 [Candidatus Xenohaliotis californiensis]